MFYSPAHGRGILNSPRPREASWNSCQRQEKFLVLLWDPACLPSSASPSAPFISPIFLVHGDFSTRRVKGAAASEQELSLAFALRL